jgi:hypothetical protein
VVGILSAYSGYREDANNRGRTIEGAGPAPLRILRFTDWISRRVHTAIFGSILLLIRMLIKAANHVFLRVRS